MLPHMPCKVFVGNPFSWSAQSAPLLSNAVLFPVRKLVPWVIEYIRGQEQDRQATFWGRWGWGSGGGRFGLLRLFGWGHRVLRGHWQGLAMPVLHVDLQRLLGRIHQVRALVAAERVPQLAVEIFHVDVKRLLRGVELSRARRARVRLLGPSSLRRRLVVVDAPLLDRRARLSIYTPQRGDRRGTRRGRGALRSAQHVPTYPQG